MDSDSSGDGFLPHILVPVANPEDARTTAASLAPLAPERVTVLHVIEKAHGYPDRLSVEQAEALATASFAAFEEELPGADTCITYRGNVVAAIFDVATELEVTAVAFHSRKGGLFTRLMTSDRANKLVTHPPVPVISLPDAPDE